MKHDGAPRKAAFGKDRTAFNIGDRLHTHRRPGAAQ